MGERDAGVSVDAPSANLYRRRSFLRDASSNANIFD